MHVFVKRQRLISTRPFSNGDSEVTVKVGSRRGLENGLGGPEKGVKGRRGHHGEDDRGGVESGNETENENEDNENNENDEEEEDVGEGPFVPFHAPGKNQYNITGFQKCSVSLSSLYCDGHHSPKGIFRFPQ